MFAIGRRSLLLGAAALAACNQASGGGGLTEDDVVLVKPNANPSVTLIEYASATCPHCAAFHAEVFERLKTNYIDTGKIRYVFREFLTPPAEVALAGFQLARCGGASPDQYFVRLGEVFRQRQSGALFASGTMGGVRQKLVEIGGAAGLSEQQVIDCINDQEGAERVRRIAAAANRDFQVDSTPTFVLNGRRVDDPRVQTYEGLSQLIDAELAS